MNRPGTLTWLYPQAMDCAVLYSPDREQKRPLHLNPGRPDWNADVYKNVLPAIKSINLEQRKKGDRNRSFLHCEIRDENNGDTEAGWKIIAQPLGL